MRQRLVMMVFLGIMAFSFTVFAKNKVENDAHMKAAFELVENMQQEKIFQKTITSVVEMQIKQNPRLSPYKSLMLNFFKKYMSWKSLKNDFAKMYADLFTTKELKELKKFYMTPIGKKMVLLTPEISTRSMSLGMQKVRMHMGELIKMIANENKRIQKKRKSQKVNKKDKKK